MTQLPCKPWRAVSTILFLGAPLCALAAPRSSEQAPRPKRRAIQIGAVRPASPLPAAPLSPLESRVTVRVKGAPLTTFLDTISAQSKVSFMVSEGLGSKKVTAFLQNVTVREALQILLEIKGLTYLRIGKSNTYVISERSRKAERKITRIYRLSHIPLVPLGAEGKKAPAARQ